MLMNNTTAVTFINRKGGTHSRSLSDLVIALWSWCLQRNLTIIHSISLVCRTASRFSVEETAGIQWLETGLECIPGSVEEVGPFRIDLFAARHNTQLRSFFSYHPDPESLASDALAQNWKGWSCYAFPPFALMIQVLQKIRQDKVRNAVIIAPNWPSQIWSLALTQMLTDYPHMRLIYTRIQ